MAGVAGLAPSFSEVRVLFFLSFCETKMAGVAGLEPTTPGFGDQCSTN